MGLDFFYLRIIPTLLLKTLGTLKLLEKSGNRKSLTRTFYTTPLLGVTQTLCLVNRVFVPCQKGGRFDENAKIANLQSTHWKQGFLLRPPKTTNMTKMAGVTQAKAWFRKSRVCSSLTFWMHKRSFALRVDESSTVFSDCDETMQATKGNPHHEHLGQSIILRAPCINTCPLPITKPTGHKWFCRKVWDISASLDLAASTGSSAGKVYLFQFFLHVSLFWLYDCILFQRFAMDRITLQISWVVLDFILHIAKNSPRGSLCLKTCFSEAVSRWCATATATPLRNGNTRGNGLAVGCTPRKSCKNALLGRVLRSEELVKVVTVYFKSTPHRR